MFLKHFKNVKYFFMGTIGLDKCIKVFSIYCFQNILQILKCEHFFKMFY